MNQINTLQEILALISIAEEEQATQQEQNEADALAEAEKATEALVEQAKQLFEKVKHLIPDVILPYLLVDGRVPGHGDSNWWEKSLEFHIPGLAPIAMFFAGVIREDEQPKLSYWLVAGVCDLDWDQKTDICKTAGFSFESEFSYKAKAGETNLRQVLLAAKIAFENKEDRQIELDQSIVRHHKRMEKREQEEARVISEEQALFEVIKNDPIAIHMLKAFILLRDERSAFEQRLEEMGEEMYGMENRWSRKAEELRHQAEYAERRARDEQSRLQSDLDDAEAKLKKAERGW